MSDFSGNKYFRTVLGVCGKKATVDVYRVLTAFNVVSPPIQHGIKKLLCAGIRGKGSEVQDLKEARDCISARLLELEQLGGERVIPEETAKDVPSVELLISALEKHGVRMLTRSTDGEIQSVHIVAGGFTFKIYARSDEYGWLSFEREKTDET